MSFAPRIVSAAFIAAGVGSAAASPTMAHGFRAATLAFLAQDPVVVDIPQAEIQSVRPALAAYALAVDRIQVDRASGNRGTLSQDFLVAAQARQNLITAQLAVNLVLMPQLAANAQTALQARDQLLMAQAASTATQRRQLAAASTPATAASGTASVTVSAAPAAPTPSAQALPAAEQAYLVATGRLQADQASGNSAAQTLDAAAVQQAQQTLFSAELAAGPSAPLQLAAAAQAARQSLLLATQRLAADRASGNSGAMAQDAVMVDLANQALAGAQAAATATATSTPAASTPRATSGAPHAAATTASRRATVALQAAAPDGERLGIARRR